MCLAIPMKVAAVDWPSARCAAGGIEREVSLYLLPEGFVSVGDYVVVHVGYAIQKVTAQEACATWELFDDMQEMDATRQDA